MPAPRCVCVKVSKLSNKAYQSFKMPVSGVSVPDICITQFNNMKLRKKQRCIIYIIRDEKEFVIHKEIDKNDEDQAKQYESIMTNEIIPLAEKTSCFVVWDLKLPTKISQGASAGTQQVQQGAKGNEGSLLVSMGVCLDSLRPKEKMMYAASIKALKEKLEGISNSVDIKSPGELDLEAFKDVLKVK